MSNKFNLLAVLSLYLAGTNVVYALSCKNGDSSCSSQSAADCTNLGYSADNVDNCKHYLYCPFNQSYKTCVAFCSDEHCKAWSSELEDCECTECEDFYEKKNGKCVPMTCDDDNKTADDCKDTEIYVVDKTLLNNEVCGHCVDCADENDPNSPCKGYYTCSGGGRSPKGDVKCTCGNVNYYEDCEVVETCFAQGWGMSQASRDYGCIDSLSKTKIYTYTTSTNVAGYYLVGEKCTNLKNEIIYAWADCTTKKDCKGNKGPAYGLEYCGDEDADGIGEPVECGGRKYFEKCTCSFDDINDIEKEGCTLSLCQSGPGYGEYLVGTKCTRSYGGDICLYAKCNTEKDCKGNKGPVYGLLNCKIKADGIGEPVECGGSKYFKFCDPCTLSTPEGIGYRRSTEDIKGYYKIGEKCTRLDGSKVYLYRNCQDNKGPAYGLKACSEGTGIGEPVECGGEKYFKGCTSDDECNLNDIEGCITSLTSEKYYADYYKVGEKCTRLDGSKVYLLANCTTEKDCKGNKGPAYGLRRSCPFGYYATGTIVECGGHIYSSDCAVSCKYEQKESDCTDGETFTPYCLDANHVWYGECK